MILCPEAPVNERGDTKSSCRVRFACEHPYLYDALLNAWRVLRRCFHRRLKLPAPSTRINPVDADSRGVIFFCVYWMSPGGAEHYALECARIAVNKGFKVVWLVDRPAFNSAWDAQYTEISESTFALWEHGGQDEAVHSMIRLTASHRPVAWHIHHSAIAYRAASQAKAIMPSLKIIDSTHAIELKDGGFPALSAAAGQAIDVRNVISKGLACYFVDRGIPMDGICRSVIVRDQEALKAKTPKTPDGGKVVVLILGRLEQQKRPYLYFPFARALQRKLSQRQGMRETQIEVRIVGAGTYAPELLRLGGPVGSNVFLRIQDQHFDKARLYQGVHFVVQLSENEGISLVGFEAILNGCCFIATDVGQQAEIMEGCFLVERKSKNAVESAASLVVKVLDDPNGYAQALVNQQARIRMLTRCYGYQSSIDHLYEELRDDKDARCE